MKTKSLILYILIIALNLFLFLPVFYSYLILSPAHILIYWLSFDSILLKKTFVSNWSTLRFVGIAFACQWVFFMALIFASGNEVSELVSTPLFIAAFTITVIEALLLGWRYEKYISKTDAG